MKIEDIIQREYLLSDLASEQINEVIEDIQELTDEQANLLFKEQFSD